jgi:spore coat polysaccharide biosynthesis predicted glycosyltransferase SpsG
MARDGGVLFRVAAGPRCGFGHLVRCRSLARALGVEPRVSLRGTQRTRRIAARCGWTVVDIESDRQLRALAPALLVIDDPSPAGTRSWLARARRLGVPVATIHDLGGGYAPSDLIVDGSIRPGARPKEAPALLGPAFAILDPSFASVRSASQPRSRRILIALGGGTHVRRLAGDLCREIVRRVPDAEIRVVQGFVSRRRLPVLRTGRWVTAPGGLSDELSTAAAAIVAGGVTLYEACAMGVPVVGLAVTGEQQHTIQSIARHRAVIDGGGPSAIDRTARCADAIARFLSSKPLRRRYSAAACALVDGRGAFRVAVRLRRLMAEGGTRAA